MDSTVAQLLPGDLLTGAKAIAEYLGPTWNRRKVYWASENNYLPIGRIGNQLFARKSELDRATSAVVAAGSTAA